MHLLDAPATLRDALYSNHYQEMSVLAFVSGYSKTVDSFAADGTPSFGAVIKTAWLDVNRIESASWGMSMPPLPEDGANDNYLRASEAVITFANTDGYFAAKGLDGIFDPDRITEATVTIIIQVGGDTDTRLPIYRGKPVGPLEERNGETTMRIRDVLWEAVQTALKFDKIGPGQSVQQIFNGTVISSTEVSNPEALVGADANYHDAPVRFTSTGKAATSVTVTDPDRLGLEKIRLYAGAPLGKYKITMRGAGQFSIQYPDGVQTSGTTAGFDDGILRIEKLDWVIVGDPTGVVIEFHAAYVADQCAATILMNLVSRAFNPDWGGPFTYDASMPVRWDKFRALREDAKNWHIHMDATNLDNKVFDRREAAKPMSCLGLANQIAQHLGARLYVDTLGFLNVSLPFEEGVERVISDSGDYPAIISHAIEGTKGWNVITLQYGGVTGDSNWSGQNSTDLRPDPLDTIVEKRFTFPFYKRWKSGVEISALACRLVDRVAGTYTVHNITVKPNWGITLNPGDRFRLVTNQSPRIDEWVEVFSVDKQPGEPISIKCFTTVAPAALSRYCSAVYCVDKFS